MSPFICFTRRLYKVAKYSVKSIKTNQEKYIHNILKISLIFRSSSKTQIGNLSSKFEEHINFPLSFLLTIIVNSPYHLPFSSSPLLPKQIFQFAIATIPLFMHIASSMGLGRGQVDKHLKEKEVKEVEKRERGRVDDCGNEIYLPSISKEFIYLNKEEVGYHESHMVHKSGLKERKKHESCAMICWER